MDRGRQPLPEPEVAQAPEPAPVYVLHTTPPRNVGGAVGNPESAVCPLLAQSKPCAGANSKFSKDFCGAHGPLFEGRVQL